MGMCQVATFLLTYEFRCGKCDSNNNDQFLLAADSRSELERTIRQVHLGCKFCGSATAVNKQMKMLLDEATAPAVVKGRRGITEIRDADPSDDFEPC